MDCTATGKMEDIETLLAELSAVQPDILKLVTEGKTPIVNVKAGSKVERLLKFANSKMQDPDANDIVWTGEDKAISKVISCAEIMKREIKNLYQVTNIYYIKTEPEAPSIKGKPKNKVNMRSVISIYLSKKPIPVCPTEETRIITDKSKDGHNDLATNSFKRKRKGKATEQSAVQSKKKKL